MKDWAGVKDLPAAEVQKRLLQPGVVLVDVREPAEHQAERIAGALLCPLSTFDPLRLPAGELIFHCGIGKRSLVAIQKCEAAGLPHRAHLLGGLAAWKQAGLPTLSG